MEQILKTDIGLPDWSFKSIDAVAFRKLEKSIIKHGQTKNIVVRTIGEGKYEVIDGKEVFEILKRQPIDYIWCKVKRDLSRLDAILFYLQLDFNFDTDYIELAKSIRKLSKNHSNIEISRLVNMSVKEIKDLITLNDFDFERYKPISKQEQKNFF
jgi:hypothetical protein